MLRFFQKCVFLSLIKFSVSPVDTGLKGPRGKMTVKKQNLVELSLDHSGPEAHKSLQLRGRKTQGKEIMLPIFLPL